MEKKKEGKFNKGEILIYKPKSGKIELKVKFQNETIWLDAHQMAQIFDVNRPAVVKHINNIYKTGELNKNSTCSILEQVASDGKVRKMNLYNLDAIISVGYRVNSQKATQFRIWATKILKGYLVDGFVINKKSLVKNYEVFLKAVEDVKKLLPSGGQVKPEDVLELIKMFASTWFSLDAYDKDLFPQKGATKKQVKVTAVNVLEALDNLKKELIAKEEATEIFGQERLAGSIAGIIGSVFQSFGGKELYPTVEEKASHLLYFIVKNHPLVDGNKRSGAFTFVWFLRKAKILNTSQLTPEALTVLTLLVAESDPSHKERMIGLVLMLLKK